MSRFKEIKYSFERNHYGVFEEADIGWMIDRVEKLESCRSALERAVDLGYLGDGSINGFAIQALKDAEE